jgi:hypothetical protein
VTYKYSSTFRTISLIWNGRPFTFENGTASTRYFARIIVHELPQVHLRNDHCFKSGKHFAEVSREWVSVTQMSGRNALPVALHLLDSLN